MAGPFAFLLGEQESAQEKQLENDQYKEDAGEIDCHAHSKISLSHLFTKIILTHASENEAGAPHIPP